MKPASFGAAVLPILSAQDSQAAARECRVCAIGHDGDYGPMVGAFASSPKVTIAAVADPVEKARLEHAKRLKAPRSYADFREMLRKEKPDIVGIGPNRKTYSAHRLEMIRAAEELGIQVMVDKPHAPSPEEADPIITLAEQHKIQKGVYHPVRVAPAVVHPKKLVTSRPFQYAGPSRKPCGWGSWRSASGAHRIERRRPQGPELPRGRPLHSAQVLQGSRNVSRRNVSLRSSSPHHTQHHSQRRQKQHHRTRFGHRGCVSRRHRSSLN